MSTLPEEAHQRILEMCRSQLKRANPPNTKALYGRAVRIDEDIRDLSLRQFHAKFPLRVKREWARAEKKKNARAPESETEENGVRTPASQDRIAALFLEFGREVALASSFEEISQLVERADDYVDRILRAQEE